MSLQDFLKNYKQLGFTFTFGNVPFGLKVNGADKRSEVLFSEKCLELTEFRSELLVPDSILACSRDFPFRQWVLANFRYLSSVSFTYGKGGIFYNSPAKTSAMIIDRHKPGQENYKIFMAIVEKDSEFKQLRANWLDFIAKES